MTKYLYKCSTCNSQFSQEIIETNLSYLCPKCGRADKNEPLEGVLLLEYDYAALAKKLKLSDVLKLKPGSFWDFPWLFPLEFVNGLPEKISANSLAKLKLNENPVLLQQIEGKSILIFDDTRNPTLSFKDRASMLVVLKAKQLGINEIAAASTGNAGSSLAGICARSGLKSHIFVPEKIPAGKRLQIQAYGARLYLIKGDYDQAFDLCLEAAQKKGWYNRNTGYNPLTIEGKKSAAFDIFLALKGNVPEVIFVPVGDGVIIAGLFKGFWELKQLGWIEKIPRLMAVQSTGSDALVRYLKTGVFEFRPADSIADSICAGAPRNLYLAARAVRESKGEALAVADAKILAAQTYLAQKMGVLAEPAAAASLAGYFEYLEINKLESNEKVMLLLTGNGLKDLSALERWNRPVEAKGVAEWKKHFGI